MNTRAAAYDLGYAVTVLLEALQPWTFQQDKVRKACVELTLSLAAFQNGKAA